MVPGLRDSRVLASSCRGAHFTQPRDHYLADPCRGLEPRVTQGQSLLDNGLSLSCCGGFIAGSKKTPIFFIRHALSTAGIIEVFADSWSRWY